MTTNVTANEGGAAALELEGVTYTYPGAEAPAVEGVNLRVSAGERLGILGPNGGGKSTLLRLVLGELGLEGRGRGRIEVLGRSPARARAEGLIGYLPQRPAVERSMPMSGRQVVELSAGWRTAAWRGLPGECRSWVERVLEMVGATGFADRPIGKMSGGQLQRVLIARALAGRPRVLVLDEPAVGIDAAGQRMLAEMLDRVHREMGVTIVIVSHDLRAIAAGSDRVACLARRLHYHDSPRGLTPALLAELFSHDVIGSLGVVGSGGEVGPVHVHAHAAADCPAHGASIGSAGAVAGGEAGCGGHGREQGGPRGAA